MLGSVHCDEVRLSALGRCLSNAVCKIINIHQHQPTLISCTNTQTRLHQRMRKGKQKMISPGIILRHLRTGLM